MRKIIKVFLIIGVLFIVAIITFTILTFLFMGKYLEQYNEWKDE